MVSTRNSKGYATPQKPKSNEDNEQVEARMATRSQKKTKVEPSLAPPSNCILASQTSPKPSHHQHKGEDKVHYEFGGPIGAFGVIFGLPIVIYGLYFLCNDKVCVQNPFLFDWKNWAQGLPSYDKLFSWEATRIFLGWMAAHVLMERFLPGASVEGTVLPNGKRLTYVISGHLQFWVTLVLIFYGVPRYVIEGAAGDSSVWNYVISIRGFSALDLTLVYDYYVQLITASVLFSFLLSFYLFFSSYWGDKILAKGGDTPSPLYNFFIGRELNPRIGTLDLKEFCELRPGLIGWAVINLAMAVTQYTKNSQAGGQGYISLSMLCIVFLQGQYVWDGLYNEPAILSTMDITTDGFGYMLAFGDLAWVPFIYSLQARYLVDHDPHLSLLTVVGILLLHSFGFYIFRAANSQKDAFRRDPSSPEVQHLTFLATKRGTKLLTSGWWGMARKINYTGDWIITFAWCLLCGFDSPVPYFQAIYFAVLLYHRAMRDDELCHEKYGDDWLEYKRRVPYLFIPYVF